MAYRSYATLLASLFVSGSLLACGGETGPAIATSSGGNQPAKIATYHADARAIIEAKCINCHVDGSIAPFALTDYQHVKDNAASAKSAIEQGTMPPWHPDEACNDYRYDRSLSQDERDTLLAFFGGDMQEGDPADYVAPQLDSITVNADLSLEMAEAYTPQVQPDDHRCFIIEWPETETKYITAYQIVPGRSDVVHHVIVFKVAPGAADAYRAMAEAEAGAGYECFGGPAANGSGGAAQANASMIGAWVPGSAGGRLPSGTGLAVEPGSLFVMQMHYNTQTAKPAPDQTTLQVELVDTVDKPGVAQLFTKIEWLSAGGMPIPAGDKAVTLKTEISVDQFMGFTGGWDELGLAPGSDIVIHAAGLHMHRLGQWSRATVKHADGSESCLIEIDDWDFDWQGQYALRQPITMNAGKDSLTLSCTWDNSQANQPFVDGKQATPQDVEWGDGSGAEMCLTALFITAP
jgi:hypothetical protein